MSTPPCLTCSGPQNDRTNLRSVPGQSYMCPRYSVAAIKESCSSWPASGSTTVTETWYHTVYSCRTTPTSYVSRTVTVTLQATSGIRTGAGLKRSSSLISTASEETAHQSSGMHTIAAHLTTLGSLLTIMPTIHPCPHVGYICVECPGGYFCPPVPTPAAECACGMGWACAACSLQCFCPAQQVSAESERSASLLSASWTNLDRELSLPPCSNGNWVPDNTHCRYDEVGSSPSPTESFYTRSSTNTGTQTKLSPLQDTSNEGADAKCDFQTAGPSVNRCADSFPSEVRGPVNTQISPVPSQTKTPRIKDHCSQDGTSIGCLDLAETKHHPTVSRAFGVFWPAFTPQDVQWGPNLELSSTTPTIAAGGPSVQVKKHPHTRHISIRRRGAQNANEGGPVTVIRRASRYRHF